MSCSLPHIPARLHTNGREAIDYFSIGELLFRRCKEIHKHDPFGTISLVDISVNREGPDDQNILSEPEDVLLNSNLSNGRGEIIKDEVVSKLEIKEVNESEQYYKILLKGENTCKIHLIHDITPCNYSHCAFKIYYNNIEIDSYDRYDETLKKNKELRTLAKLELSKMYIKEELRINWDTKQ